MLYEEMEKKEIERVYAVFADYIRRGETVYCGECNHLYRRAACPDTVFRSVDGCVADDRQRPHRTDR